MDNLVYSDYDKNNRLHRRHDHPPSLQVNLQVPLGHRPQHRQSNQRPCPSPPMALHHPRGGSKHSNELHLHRQGASREGRIQQEDGASAAEMRHVEQYTRMERRNEMKISELIELLQDLQEKKGDIELLVSIGSKYEDECEFVADKEGGAI